ncbi:hypothetical protein BDR07DRAFT_920453 [Suillus spraguei]|nr:hypothetical protein BDR07DRAFT_920453 [Suillus spraguei]
MIKSVVFWNFQTLFGSGTTSEYWVSLYLRIQGPAQDVNNKLVPIRIYSGHGPDLDKAPAP